MHNVRCCDVFNVLFARRHATSVRNLCIHISSLHNIYPLPVNVKDMCFWLNGPLAIEDHIAGDYVDQTLVD